MFGALLAVLPVALSVVKCVCTRPPQFADAWSIGMSFDRLFAIDEYSLYAFITGSSESEHASRSSAMQSYGPLSEALKASVRLGTMPCERSESARRFEVAFVSFDISTRRTPASISSGGSSFHFLERGIRGESAGRAFRTDMLRETLRFRSFCSRRISCSSIARPSYSCASRYTLLASTGSPLFDVAVIQIDALTWFGSSFRGFWPGKYGEKLSRSCRV